MAEQHYYWWQTGVVYQIYPRSFMDSNDDGIGDLQGIISRLDYLEELGIDAIWISPIFPSPMADFGYDVADYTGIDPIFGSLEDFDALVAAARSRGIRVLLDLVPNHSSDEHPWFVESRSSRDNPKRDWYIWRDPGPDGGPPNNWHSFFGGSAWKYDEQTGQYFLHLFDPKQADLNWRNPEVRAAIYDAMRFWLDRGVGGFRVDVIWLMIKDSDFRDNPLNPDWNEGDDERERVINVYAQNQPEVHEVIREMRAVIDEYDERVLIGEIYLPVPDLVQYYGQNLDESHLPFNFQLILLPWQATHVRAAIDEYEAALPEGAWPNWVLGNHDQPRVASRIGRAQSRVAHMLLLTLRGTPTIYNGDELALESIPVPVEMMHDPQARIAPELSRDHHRTPVQWDASANAGFSGVAPWLPVAPDYATYNVAAERDDPRSMLSLIKRLIAIRRDSSALTIGGYRPVNRVPDTLIGYIREHGDERLLVVLNLGTEQHTLDLSAATGASGGTLRCSTHLDREGPIDLAQLELRPDEGVIIALA